MTTYLTHAATKIELGLKPSADRHLPTIMSSTASGPTECCICFEGFNKTRRKMVRCAYCSIDDVAFCRACVETYLTQDDAQAARCPNPSCRTGWSEDFLSDNLTATFLNGAYKRCREKVLVDLERARLPETQEDAQRFRSARDVIKAEFQPTIDRIQAQIEALPEVVAEKATKQEYDRARRAYPYHSNEVRNAFRLFCEKQTAAYNARKHLNAELAALRSQEAYRDASHMVDTWGHVTGPGAARERTTHWTFVMKCAAGACEGFVGTNWTCGLCAVKHCKDCREPKTTEADHVCDEEKRQTAAALVKEAKPCPKCAAMISKIDGCDQMWCTQCRTAFSWRTGAVESSHVHNPHYFEWMRRNGAGAVQQQRQPLPECVAPMEIIDAVHYQFIRDHAIGDWVRTLRHYYYDLRRIEQTAQHKQDDEWRRRLRIQRLVGDIGDDEWKVKLQKGEKSAHKNQRHAQVLQTFIHAGADILRTFMDGTATRTSVLEQMQQLTAYCNEQLTTIRSRYKNQVDALVFLDSTPQAHRYTLPEATIPLADPVVA